MTPNSYKVPKRQWQRWNDAARRIFNDVYCGMAYNQSLFVHPKAKVVPDEHWTTTAWNAAWNAAWTAADASQGIDAVAVRKAA